MKKSTQYLLKLILLIIIVLFALFNYKFISFDKGISKTNMDNMSVRQALTTITNITKIEYYHRPFMKGRDNSVPQPSNYQPYDYIYRVYIVTNNEAYLLKATQDDIDAFNTIGIFSKSLKPNKITPIPYYIEIIIGFLILVIPFGIPKQKKDGWLLSIAFSFIHLIFFINLCTIVLQS